MTDRLSYEVHAGNGPYALLITGGLGTRSNWALNVAALAKVCRPVVVELWGHGRSPVPTDSSAHGVAQYLDALDAIRLDLGVADWFVVAQSMAVGLAAHLALARPSTVRAMVITNDTAAAADVAGRAELLGYLGGLARSFRSVDGAEALRTFLRNPSLGEHRARIEPAVRAVMEAELDEIDPVAVADLYERTAPELWVRDRLGDLACPVLLVRGDYEERFRPIAEHMASAIPTIEVIGTPAGHVVNIEADKVFNMFAAAFLRRHTSSPA